MVTFREDYYLKQYSGKDLLIAWGCGAGTIMLLVVIPLLGLLR